MHVFISSFSRVHEGRVQEIFFTIYGKFFEAGATVRLRGNFSKEITDMYTVFIVPADDADTASVAKNNFFSQIDYERTYDRAYASQCWQDGREGLTLFYSSDDVISIGVNNGKAWSDDLQISMNQVSHRDSFEVVDWSSNFAYQLSYQMRYMPGIFEQTQEVVVMPRFCVVNLLDEELMLVQRGSREICTYLPYRSAAWHKSDVHLGTSVQLRSRSSFWSLGTVDVNEIGTSSLHLPRKDDSADGNKAIILHVEVRVSEPGENCSVTIVIWRARVESSCDISIENTTGAYVTVMQDGIELDRELSDRNLFQLCVSPFSSVPFGWADPDLDSTVLVGAGNKLDRSGRGVVRLSMLKAGEKLRVPSAASAGGSDVVVSVVAKNGRRVLRIAQNHTERCELRASALQQAARSRLSDIERTEYILQPQGSTTNTNVVEPVANTAGPKYEVNFFLSSFGLSVVVEKPTRREFLSLYVDGLSLQNTVTGSIKTFELQVANLQVDNYSETAIHPVLLHDLKDSASSSSEETGNNEGTKAADKPLLQLTLIKEDSGPSTMPIVKYMVCRMLPMSFQVDSASIQLLYTDLLNDLKYVSREQSMASASPNCWMDEQNRFLLSAERQQVLDVYNCKARTQTSKIYFEHLIIHPIKITITFVQAPFPRKGTSNITLHSTAMNIITSLAGVDKMELKLKSFRTSNALESVPSIRAAFVHKTLQDVQGQLHRVLGSMAALGSPIGFVKKLGGGVTDLFYEPYQGAVLSPSDFILGIGKGTTSFASNVVSGVMDSVGAISGTASKGFGYLSGDGDYVRQRALQKQRARAQQGGILDGILDGAESITSGVTSGISGLVSKPYEGAQKSGAGGFFKGIGLGILGAVVKPVMGITDGVSAISSGVSNQVTSDTLYAQVRPVRAMERASTDQEVLTIGRMNVKAAYAQEFVTKRSKAQGYEDTFLSYTVLDAQADECIILSETYVYWRRERSLWGRTWSNVSHCLFFGAAVGIVLYATQEGKGEIVNVGCYTQEKAVELYEARAEGLLMSFRGL